MDKYEFYEAIRKLPGLLDEDLRAIHKSQSRRWEPSRAMSDACAEGLGRVLRALGDHRLYQKVSEYGLWETIIVSAIHDTRQSRSIEKLAKWDVNTVMSLSESALRELDPDIKEMVIRYREQRRHLFWDINTLKRQVCREWTLEKLIAAVEAVQNANE